MTRTVLTLVGLAVSGAVAGQLVAPGKARACECSPDQWRLELDSVISSDATVDHTEYWPTTATLLTYTGYASINADHFEPGSVSYALAQEF